MKSGAGDSFVRSVRTVGRIPSYAPGALLFLGNRIAGKCGGNENGL